MELGLPRNPRFLVNTVVFTVLLFFVYYMDIPFVGDNIPLHEQLASAYYGSFWHDPDPVFSNDMGVSFQALSPRYISQLVEREIVISITNNYTDTVIAPSVIVLTEIVSVGEAPPQQWLIWQSSMARGKQPYSGRNVLELGDLPPQGQVTESVWVRVAPGEPKPASVRFDYCVMWENGTGGDVPDLNRRGNDDTVSCPSQISIESARATVNASKTVQQGIVQALLLPPLTNILLPLLALFFSLLYEGILAVGKRWLNHESKFFRQNVKNLNEWAKEKGEKFEQGLSLVVRLLFFLFVSVYAVLFISQITQVSVFLLGEQDNWWQITSLWWCIIVAFLTVAVIVYVQGAYVDESSEIDDLRHTVDGLGKKWIENCCQTDQEQDADPNSVPDMIQRLGVLESRVEVHDISYQSDQLQDELIDIRNSINKHINDVGRHGASTVQDDTLQSLDDTIEQLGEAIQELKSKKLNSSTHQKLQNRVKVIEDFKENPPLATMMNLYRAIEQIGNILKGEDPDGVYLDALSKLADEDWEIGKRYNPDIAPSDDGTTDPTDSPPVA